MNRLATIKFLIICGLGKLFAYIDTYIFEVKKQFRLIIFILSLCFWLKLHSSDFLVHLIPTAENSFNAVLKLKRKKKLVI